jgi:hypothetical protein
MLYRGLKRIIYWLIKLLKLKAYNPSDSKICNPYKKEFSCYAVTKSINSNDMLSGNFAGLSIYTSIS